MPQEQSEISEDVPQSRTSSGAGSLGVEQLERLLEVGRRLVTEFDLEPLLRRILDAARELTGARFAALGVLDEEKRQLEKFVFVGIDEKTRARIGRLPSGHGILGELIRNPRPLRLARISDHPRSYGFPAEHPPMETFLGVPVTIRGNAFGNLYLTEKADGAHFDDRDERLALILAEWAAIAIDNARAHEVGERRRRELERMVRGLEATAILDRELSGETDRMRVLELTAKRARALVGADSCLVVLSDGDILSVAEAAGELGDARGRELPSEGSPAAEVMRSGSSRRIGPDDGATASALGVPATALLLVPIRARGRSLGALVVLDPIDAEEFSADEELLLNSFAASAANALVATQSVEEEIGRMSVAASERERRRWARELHDETLQELGALRLMQESAIRRESIEEVREDLTGANQQIQRLISELGGLITELRPAALDQLGVEPALAALVERIEDREGLEIDADFDLAPERGAGGARLTPELEATVYRIVQESLNNVVKHAAATRARIAVEERDDRVLIRVEDDGRGFDFGRESSEPAGFGLLGLRERVTLLGGELSIGPGARGGTRVSATLPVLRRARAPG